MPHFFIDRPIFAWVIAIIIMFGGLLAIFTLPISQYPVIAPPTVAISTTYPGANAETVENTVTKIIEQNMVGLDGYMYMTSTSDSYGMARIEITFIPGTDPDVAQMQVQNKLQTCQSQLPDAVINNGIDVKKATNSFLMVISLISDSPAIDEIDLSDYAESYMKEPISRIEGVGDIFVFGSSYAMRIWLDPDKLNSVNVTVPEISAAVQAQNAQVTMGALGGAPAVKGQVYSFNIIGQSRLTNIKDIENIVIRTNENGTKILLKDIARIELSNENFSFGSDYNGKKNTGIGIRLATGANALGTAERIKNEVQKLSQYFPANVSYLYPYDTTEFIKISIGEVVDTLFIAIILVFFVMYIFLQNIRATIIPTIAVPVVLLGTFGIMSVLNYSINTLTMFGLVLAIGLLVDDAIVVVENVERIIHDSKVSAYEATKKSMNEITGALIGIALVLTAVFIPMAFFGGSTGVIYRQFSITIISAMLLSMFTALSLTPALCATILKGDEIENPSYKGISGFLKKYISKIFSFLTKPLLIILNKFFTLFNKSFTFCSDTYVKFVRYVVKNIVLYIVIYIVICAITAFMFLRIPSSFLPEEDQGAFMVQVQLPPGATMERTWNVMHQMRDYFLTNEKDNVYSVMSIVGFSFAGSGQNSGMAFVKLKPWDVRKDPQQHVSAIVQRAFPNLMAIKEGIVIAFNLPAIPELGIANGFDFYFVDPSQGSHKDLTDARNLLLAKATQGEGKSVLTRVRANGLDDTPMLKVQIDYAKALAQGVSVASINTTLSTAWGSAYIDDFMERNRVKKIYLQAEAAARMNEEDFNKWYVKNSSGKLVPFNSYAKTYWTYGSPRLERFNGLPAMQINGEALEGKSTGQAMDMMEKLVNDVNQETGKHYSAEWHGTSFQEKQAGAQAPALYAISLLFVFLCLAALYESWSIPFSVMLVVPLGVFGAVGAAYLTQMFPGLFPWTKPLENDVYFQVGLLTTVGLSAKNAILIVEFAKDLHDKGVRLSDAVVEAARIRLRPILMTSFAFILGVFPLAISTGAGAAGRNQIGICVIGGMISATLLAIFFVPIFFIFVMRYFTRYKPHKQMEQTQTAKV